MKEKEETIGILTKDFIKQHIKIENELENKIVKLEDKIKLLNTQLKLKESIGGAFKINDDNLTKAFNILLNILRYGEVVYSDANNGYSLSINNLYLNSDEADFVINLINADHNQSLTNFNSEFDKHWEETGKGSNSKWSSRHKNIIT